MSNRSSLALSTRTVKIYSGAADAQARADLAEHVADVANPHDVTAAQVGLGNADNTSDADKPVSGPQADALALLAPLANPVLTGTPTAPTAPLGTVTDQVATTAFAQAAVNLVGNEVGEVGADLDTHLGDHANPHAVTKAQVGLALADNTADAAKPVSGPQQTAINAAAAIGNAAQADIDGHQANSANPHSVTKSQVGLALADNTADAAKPVSGPQQTAINAAAAIGNAAQADIDGHQANSANPHSVTKSQVGLALVDNTADLAKPVSTAQQTAINVATAAASAAQADIDGHQLNVSNPHVVTKAQVGLGNADNTSDLTKPVSNPTQAAINAAVGAVQSDADAVAADLADHLADVANPHTVTKAQVGLGSADNTSDAAKPVSTATAAALAAKAPLASPALTGIPTAPTAPPGTSTLQLATTAFVDTLGDSLLADLDGAANAADRPGDAVALYGTLATGTPAAMPRVDPTWVATSAAGNVLRVSSGTADDPQIIAPAAAFGVGPVYDLRWQVQRQVDPVDPLNDSVTLAIRWLTNTYAGVAGAAGISTVANLPLVISDGVVTRTARIGGGGLVPPAGAVYFRPYVQLFGNNHVTDVIVLGADGACSCGVALVTLLTATTALPEGTAGLVLVNAGAAMSVTLPPAPRLGQMLTVKDAAGNAGTRNITISGGGANIEGAATMVLNFSYGWAQLAYSGSQWVQV